MFPCFQDCSASTLIRRGALGVAWVVCASIGGCATGGDGPTAAAVGTSGHVRQTYVVQPHDTLYGIAWRHDLDYRDLARWNKIGGEYKLTVGQVLVLRAPAGGSEARPERGRHEAARTDAAPPPTAARGAVRPPPPAVAVPVPASGAGAPASNAGASSDAGMRWVWPTEHLSAPRPVPGGGILLFGKLGQEVRAAGTGRVVYTGSGIRGYGNLIIIKHGDNLLSSYAHNQEMLVHEGQDVGVGQVIARMGTGPHQVCALYFEIRVNGKPTDPLRYLTAAR